MSSACIGGSPLLSTMQTGGRFNAGFYRFFYQDERLSISGCIVKFGLQRVEWTWPYAGACEWNWWMTTYRNFPHTFNLWTDDTRSASVAFTDGVLLRPTYSNSTAPSLFKDLKIEIVGLQPLQA
jgi:hypothetical protein